MCDVWSIHLSEDFVVWSGCIHGPASNARISRLVEGVVGHHGSSMEVGGQDKIVVLHPFDDGQCLWFNLGRDIQQERTQLYNCCSHYVTYGHFYTVIDDIKVN